MHYSGRTLEPQRPPAGGLIESFFNVFRDPSHMEMYREAAPGIELPEMGVFNAVFVNWYRPPSEKEPTDKPDGLGWHADDERSHANGTILSITFTEENGERLFQMRPKKATSGCTWQCELSHLSTLLMLTGCQDSFKHCVSDQKTNLAKKKITGGRINLTFRCLKVDE